MLQFCGSLLFTFRNSSGCLQGYSRLSLQAIETACKIVLLPTKVAKANSRFNGNLLLADKSGAGWDRVSAAASNWAGAP